MNCARCGHPRERHGKPYCEGASYTEHGVFNWRPCTSKCEKFVKPKPKARKAMEEKR